MKKRDLALRMPAEWEPHEATWMIWPHDSKHWLYGSAADFESVCDTFARLVDLAAAFEPIRVVVHPGDEERVRSRIGERAELFSLPCNDAWARDILPTFVHEVGADEPGKVVGIDWIFNGWGGKFGPWEEDDRLAGRLAGLLGLGTRRSSLTAEGGALHVNGAGCFLGTKGTWFDPGRNPGWSPERLEGELRRCLGVDRFLWLDHGFEGDDTGGHVDVIAAFAGPERILHAAAATPSDPNDRSFRENVAALRRALESGQPSIDVIEVPTPEPVRRDGIRLPYSYLNFSFLNDAVLLPAFGVPLDRWVRDQFRELFPDREIVSVEARPLYLGGGGIHCVTQQQPRAEGKLTCATHAPPPQ